MAKKKTVKIDDAKTVKPNFSNAERLFLANSKIIGLLEKRVIAIEQRIDRLVDAISKSKRTKGL